MKDFKEHKKYIEAMKFRDWQTCDLISDEHKELVKEIKLLKQELELRTDWTCMHRDNAQRYFSKVGSQNGRIVELESEINLLKEELKREREGNDFTAKCGIDAHGKAVSIINQRKIKSEDL